MEAYALMAHLRMSGTFTERQLAVIAERRAQRPFGLFLVDRWRAREFLARATIRNVLPIWKMTVANCAINNTREVRAINRWSPFRWRLRWPNLFLRVVVATAAAVAAAVAAATVKGLKDSSGCFVLCMSVRCSLAHREKSVFCEIAEQERALERPQRTGG